MDRIRAWFIPSAVIAAIASLSAVGYGQTVVCQEPVSKAVANVETWIKAHPKDGAGYRTLGRIHTLAWANGTLIPLQDVVPDELPQFYDIISSVLVRRGERPLAADDAKHLTASIAAYHKAIELDSHDALSELLLGWMLAQQDLPVRDLPADYFADTKPTDAEKTTWAQAITQLSAEDWKVRDAASKTLLAAAPRCVLFLRDTKTDDPEAMARIDAVLRGHFELQALDHYRKAFELRAPEDLKTKPDEPDGPISTKAGSQILDLLAKHPEAAKKDEIKTVHKVLEQLAKKP